MKEHLEHFFLPNGFRNSNSYVSTKVGGGSKKDNWGKDRNLHGNKILYEFSESLKDQHTLAKNFYNSDDIGDIIEIEIEPDFEDVLNSLESKKHGIELLSIRKDKDTNILYAKIFIPFNKTEYLRKKILDYINPEKDRSFKKNKPNEKQPLNKKLVESIKSINKAILKSFWTDNIELLPNDINKPFKWELWLRTTKIDEIDKIKSLCNEYKIKTQENGYLKFLDRSVIVVLANIEQINKLLDSTDRIAELRKAKETAEFFVRLNNIEQKDWSDNLRKRIKKSNDIRTSICIFDTGVNYEHPLLKDFLDISDTLSYKETWTPDDQQGHGTNMAGICLYGDLSKSLQSEENIEINYNLESVKILNRHDPNSLDSYGYVTSQSVSVAEINKTINRIYCMAVTSENKNGGKPSSWSSAIDQITSGQDDSQKRLFIISAGNIPQYEISETTYTSKNELESIHDPGQSWNALVVGGYTEYTNIDDLDTSLWNPLAPVGDLSPVSTTSLIWDAHWVNKPDIVMESGNCATDGKEVDFSNSLSLLTTHHRHLEKLFTVFGDTSSSTALASQMAAIIWSKYPKLKPETVRALIIHSASWTPAMIKRANSLNNTISRKNNYLLRCYGYGVPDINKALWSMKNQLTLIIEDTIQPFKKDENKKIKMNEIHFYQLPLPKEIIQKHLSDADLEMKITLSYFIEPCPGERGRYLKHRYASYGLRFEVKSPTETLENFQKHLNKVAREEDEEIDYDNDSNKWELGSILRSKGSVHSDTWKGSGAELAEKDCIAIFPVTGWWKEKPELDHSEMIASYSLIITIKTKETTIDIYNQVKNIIANKIQIEV